MFTLEVISTNTAKPIWFNVPPLCVHCHIVYEFIGSYPIYISRRRVSTSSALTIRTFATIHVTVTDSVQGRSFSSSHFWFILLKHATRTQLRRSMTTLLTTTKRCSP